MPQAIVMQNRSLQSPDVRAYARQVISRWYSHRAQNCDRRVLLSSEMVANGDRLRSRVLWLDDDEAFLDSIVIALTDVFDITTASSLEDAESLLDGSGPYDVVVTDLVLPGGKTTAAGIDFVRAVRQKHPSVPIVVVSGFPTHYLSDLHQLGIDALVSKAEVDASALEETIAALIHERHVPHAPAANEYVRYQELRKAIEEIVTRLIPEKERMLDLAVDGRFELPKPLMGFKRDIERQLRRFPFKQNVFLMMKFRESNAELGAFMIETLATSGLRGVRADASEWNITSNVYNPIAVLYCCKFGIALFDEAEAGQAYSPNVAYELGIMHHQGKECLILRHETLPSVPFDLIKDLYQSYGRDLQVRSHIERWVRQIAPLTAA